jgi:hypothetical protein
MTEALAAIATWYFCGIAVCLRDWRFPGCESDEAVPLSHQLRYWTRVITTVFGAAFAGPWSSLMMFTLLGIRREDVDEYED